MKPVAIIGGGITGLTAAFSSSSAASPSSCWKPPCLAWAAVFNPSAVTASGRVWAEQHPGDFAGHFQSGARPGVGITPGLFQSVCRKTLRRARPEARGHAQFRLRAFSRRPCFHSPPSCASWPSRSSGRRRTVWKNRSPNLFSGDWARNSLITPLIPWWPEFTPATRISFR